VSVADTFGNWFGGVFTWFGGGDDATGDPNLAAAFRNQDTEYLRQAWINAGLTPTENGVLNQIPTDPVPPSIRVGNEIPPKQPGATTPQPVPVSPDETGQPSFGFVAPVVAAEAAAATQTTILAAVLRAVPWLTVFWPSPVADATVFDPRKKPPKRPPTVEIDPTDPYPSRRVRTTPPRVFGMPVPSWEDQPLYLPRAVPRPYVPPQPVIFDPVFEPGAMPDPLFEPVPSTPRVPQPATPSVPAPGTAPAPTTRPIPSPSPLPRMPTLPDLLPFLPLYLPGNRPGTGLPGDFGTFARPLDPFQPPTVDPLTPFETQPLPLAQPQPQPRTAQDQCTELMKRRPKKRKCVERDSCNKCVRYAPI